MFYFEDICVLSQNWKYWDSNQLRPSGNKFKKNQWQIRRSSRSVTGTQPRSFFFSSVYRKKKTIQNIPLRRGKPREGKTSFQRDARNQIIKVQGKEYSDSLSANNLPIYTCLEMENVKKITLVKTKMFLIAQKLWQMKNAKKPSVNYVLDGKNIHFVTFTWGNFSRISLYYLIVMETLSWIDLYKL